MGQRGLPHLPARARSSATWVEGTECLEKGGAVEEGPMGGGKAVQLPKRCLCKAQHERFDDESVPHGTSQVKEKRDTGPCKPPAQRLLLGTGTAKRQHLLVTTLAGGAVLRKSHAYDAPYLASAPILTCRNSSPVRDSVSLVSCPASCAPFSSSLRWCVRGRARAYMCAVHEGACT